MISKRKLLKWRKEALYNKSRLAKSTTGINLLKLSHSSNNKILEMTQELLDQQALEEFKRLLNKGE